MGKGTQPATARRGTGTLTWGALSDEEHEGLAIGWTWPWAPDAGEVAGRFVRRLREDTQTVTVAPATYGEDGTELTAAVVEPVQFAVHRVHVDEWGEETDLQLPVDAAVTLR
jgi:hypothetical protein